MPKIIKVPLTGSDRTFYRKTQVSLSRYKPEYIVKAEDSIIKSLGCGGKENAFNQKIMLNQCYQEAKMSGNTKLVNKIVTDPLFRLADLNIMPGNFIQIHTAANKFLRHKMIKNLKILQLACNYAPYLYYLKQEHGAQVFGVDNNSAAVAYAISGGLDVRFGTASYIHFFDAGSFDMIISYHFLDSVYLSLFMEKPQPFMEQVMREAHRLLKPRGFFISHAEDIEDIQTPKNQFRDSYQLEVEPNVSPINIFQK